MAISDSKLGFVLGSPLGDFDTAASSTGYPLEDAVGGFSLGTTVLGGLLHPLGYLATLPVPVGSLSLFPKDVALNMFLIVATATMSFTGFAPSINISRNVPAASLAFTGLAPNLNTGGSIPTGSLLFTGLEPTIGHVVPTGSLTFTGFAPGINVGYVVPTGSLTFTGRVPGRSAAIVVPVGSLIFTGKVPAQRLFVPAGSLTFSTFAPLQNRIVPAGLLTFTGLAPHLLLNPVVPAGSLIFTGFAPVLPNAIVPDTGSLVFTGLAPSLVNPKTVVPAAGTLIFTGQTVTLAPIVPTGHLVFTTYTPAANIPYLVDAGALNFTGLAVTILNGAALPVGPTTLILTPGNPTIYITGPFPTGSLVFTGYAPRITGSVPTGTLVFTGQPIVLLSGLAHIVPAGTLLFTGFAPALNNSPFPIVGSGSGARVWVIAFEDRTWKIEPTPVLVTSENRTDDTD